MAKIDSKDSPRRIKNNDRPAVATYRPQLDQNRFLFVSRLRIRDLAQRRCDRAMLDHRLVRIAMLMAEKPSHHVCRVSDSNPVCLEGLLGEKQLRMEDATGEIRIGDTLKRSDRHVITIRMRNPAID